MGFALGWFCTARLAFLMHHTLVDTQLYYEFNNKHIKTNNQTKHGKRGMCVAVWGGECPGGWGDGGWALGPVPRGISP